MCNGCNCVQTVVLSRGDATTITSPEFNSNHHNKAACRFTIYMICQIWWCAKCCQHSSKWRIHSLHLLLNLQLEDKNQEWKASSFFPRVWPREWHWLQQRISPSKDFISRSYWRNAKTYLVLSFLNMLCLDGLPCTRSWKAENLWK